MSDGIIYFLEGAALILLISLIYNNNEKNYASIKQRLCPRPPHLNS
jgi:hypothetical protein